MVTSTLRMCVHKNYVLFRKKLYKVLSIYTDFYVHQGDYVIHGLTEFHMGVLCQMILRTIATKS